MNKLEEIYAEWLKNPQFKKDFDKNPEKALQEHMPYITLSPHDLKKIQSMTQLIKSEILEKKINK